MKSALRLMLRMVGLTYVIKDDVLLITTPEQAESELETRVYPVGDLVIPPEANMAAPPNGSQPGSVPEANVPDGAQADFDSLIDLITSTAKPTSWDAVGGPGSIRALSNNLTITISQTQEVHEEIENLLEQLRQASRESGGRGLPMLRPRATSRDGRPDSGRGQPGMGGGMFGGPPGTAGGMGGMGGAMPARRASGAPPAQPQPADLLQGVQQTNKGFQGKQSEKLNKMYKDSGGKSGVGAGKAF